MKWLIIFFNINIFCCFLYAEDTTKIISLPEIKVIEQKVKSNSALDFVPTTIIDQQQIQTIGAKQLSEVLIFSPGVNIQNQGGLSGMKTLSMRGMSSSRNLILLDGMPLNSAQNGSFDLNNIDVSSIENIEIIRGGTSSIFGGSAIGGAVNIITKKEMKEFFNVDLSYGSFNEKGINATLNLFPEPSPFTDKDGSTNLLFNFNYLNSDGDYPFTFSQFGEEKKYYRENADYENWFFSALWKINVTFGKNKNLYGIPMTEGTKIDLIHRYSYSKTGRGIPGPILQGQINNSNERLGEREHIYSLNLKLYFINNSAFNFSVLYRNNNLLYIEPNNDNQNTSEFILNDIMVNTIYSFDFWKIKNEFLLSYTNTELNGDMLDLNKKNIVDRGIFASGYRLEKDFLIAENLLRFNLAGRYDKGISEQENTNKSALTGNLGAIFNFNNIPLSLKTNVSHNFRFPNFNEMYYKNYGTKNLLPEKSNNINIGAEYKLFSLFNICLDGFYLDVKDMIVAIPTSPISWSARNIAFAESKGIELSVALFDNIKINNFLTINNISFSYTLQQNLDKSKHSQTYNKQLPYMPNELASTLISFKIFDYVVGGKLEYSSHRYYQADNSINTLLPSYYIADFFIKSADITLYKNCKLNLRFDIKNIFDTQYFIINNYIMPSRQFRLSLGMSC